MRILFTLFTILLFAPAFAQNNVGIGTSSPHSSALLELSSSTKGLLVPRMNSSQRSSLDAPATGLLVFDTDTNTLWAYDGSAWKNLYSSGGGFTLPFAQSVNTNVSALRINNEGMGAALEGASTNEFGIGQHGKASGAFAWSVYATSSRPGASSFYAIADSGTVFNGQNLFAGNTNTLMALTNRGLGKTATLQLTNTINTGANLQISGNHAGEQLLIFQTNAQNSKAAVSVTNSGTGAGVNVLSNSGGAVVGSSTGGIGISGSSNNNYGVRGVTNTSSGFAGVYGQNTGTAGSGVVGNSDAANTQGVYGTSVNGIGVRATSNYRAVQATTTSGTALYGSSNNGYALELNGNIKISGGNTNPATGAVLTSDASGNAVWKGGVIGFKATGIRSGFPNLPYNTNTKVEFKTQEYDFAGNFISSSENGNAAEANVFYAPVNGLYHFDVSVGFGIRIVASTTLDYDYAMVNIIKVANGNSQLVAELQPNNPGPGPIINGSVDLRLNQGDRVYIEARQLTSLLGSDYSMPLYDYEPNTYFSGHLVKEL